MSRLGEKQARVDDVFHKVASRYDLMNDLMSVGLHRFWKDTLVAMLRPSEEPARSAHLDVAGGTGDVAFRILDAGGDETHVDRARYQRLDARRRRGSRGKAGLCATGSRFVECNAEALSLPDNGPSTATPSRSASAMCRAFRWR